MNLYCEKFTFVRFLEFVRKFFTSVKRVEFCTKINKMQNNIARGKIS